MQSAGSAGTNVEHLHCVYWMMNVCGWRIAVQMTSVTRVNRSVQRHCRTCNDEDGSLCYQNQRGRLSAETDVMPYVMK
jgi:hypothetical protein